MSKELNDPSTITISIDLLYRKMTYLKRLYEQRERRKTLSFVEARKLIIEDLTLQRDAAKISSAASGWAGKQGHAKLNLLNTYIPLIQKFLPEDEAVLSFKIDKDVDACVTERSFKDALMQIFYQLRAAVSDLSQFKEI